MTAREFAIKAHGEQMYGTGKPYAFHLKAVVDVLAEFGAPRDHVLIFDAAWLHDVLEDTETTEADLIAQGFSRVTIDIVKAVTDEAGKDRAERHLKTYPKIAASPCAIAVKLADRIANVRECIANGDSKFAMYSKEYASFKQGLAAYHVAESPIGQMWACLDELFNRHSTTNPTPASGHGRQP